MENRLTTKSGWLEYLKGAKEIERNIYVLERMNAELNEQVNEIQKKESAKHKAAIEQCEKDLEKAKADKPKLKQVKKTPIGEILGNAIGIAIYVAIPCTIIGGIIARLVGSEEDSYVTGFKIGAIIGVVACPLLYFIYKIFKDVKDVPRTNRILASVFEDQKKRYDEDVASAETELAEAKKQSLIPSAKIGYYNNQINYLHKSLKSLYANREVYYSVAVVPPDYRKMDCVYVLDQIFRNDLADTMREAVLLYEEHAFRGDVIRGMANIASQLNKLGGIMSSLRTDIDMIGRDVALMRDDMVNVYEQNHRFAADIKQQNNRLLEETKLHRFAVEALEKSNQMIVDYIEENR